MRPPLRVTGLHGRQAARLRHLYQTTDCPRTRVRAQMILLSSEGYPVAEIAAITHQSDDTVRRWLQRFLDQGWRGLLEAPRSGRPAAITPAVEQFLSECLQGSPRDYRIGRPTWTTALLAQLVQRRLKIMVTGECVRQHLERLNGVCRRPTWTVKHLARLKPGYAQKKAGLPGFCSTRRTGRMSTFKMKPSSACSKRSRACGWSAASSARFARPACARPSGTSARPPIGAPARSCGFVQRTGTPKRSADWLRNAWPARLAGSGA
jgi:transposase